MVQHTTSLEPCLRDPLLFRSQQPSLPRIIIINIIIIFVVIIIIIMVIYTQVQMGRDDEKKTVVTAVERVRAN